MYIVGCFPITFSSLGVRRRWVRRIFMRSVQLRWPSFASAWVKIHFVIVYTVLIYTKTFQYEIIVIYPCQDNAQTLRFVFPDRNFQEYLRCLLERLVTNVSSRATSNIENWRLFLKSPSASQTCVSIPRAWWRFFACNALLRDFMDFYGCIMLSFRWCWRNTWGAHHDSPKL